MTFPSPVRHTSLLELIRLVSCCLNRLLYLKQSESAQLLTLHQLWSLHGFRDEIRLVLVLLNRVEFDPSPKLPSFTPSGTRMSWCLIFPAPYSIAIPLAARGVTKDVQSLLDV